MGYGSLREEIQLLEKSLTGDAEKDVAVQKKLARAKEKLRSMQKVRKFNPNHDKGDGRFTFRQGGVAEGPKNTNPYNLKGKPGASGASFSEPKGKPKGMTQAQANRVTDAADLKAKQEMGRSALHRLANDMEALGNPTAAAEQRAHAGGERRSDTSPGAKGAAGGLRISDPKVGDRTRQAANNATVLGRTANSLTSKVYQAEGRKNSLVTGKGPESTGPGATIEMHMAAAKAHFAAAKAYKDQRVKAHHEKMGRSHIENADTLYGKQNPGSVQGGTHVERKTKIEQALAHTSKPHGDATETIPPFPRRRK